MTRRPQDAYFALIGNSPQCKPGDRAAAAKYLRKIETARALPAKWTPAERNRLQKLESKWRRRAEGRDPRFELAGTQRGRLSLALELQLQQVEG